MICFPESHQTVWNLFPFKGNLVLGKARSHRAPNLGCSGAESPGWFDVLPKNSARDVIHELVCCHDKDANQQLPRAAAFWIIWIVSVEECLSCSSLMQNLMQIYCSTRSVISNVTVTQYSSTHSRYHSTHTLTQGCLLAPLTSTVKSPLFTHVRSSPLSLAARLHSCCTNHSHYISNCWTFSRQTTYTHTSVKSHTWVFYEFVEKYLEFISFVK